MADDEKEGEATPSRGAEWEVVSLTASTYAAAPGPEGFDPDDDRSRQESSDPMFMSDHFVFPPSEHENLPIGPDCSEIHNETEGQDKISVEGEDRGPDITHEESRQVKFDNDSEGTQFFDDGSSFSVCDTEFEEGKGSQGLYSVPCSEKSVIAEPSDSSNQNLDSAPKYTEPNEEDEDDGPGLPCEAWWRRHALSLYRHAKEANTFWSIFVAAALTGLVILGKRWQRDKWHLQELKWQFSINDERMKRMLGPIGRFKDIIVGSHQRGPLIGSGAAATC